MTDTKIDNAGIRERPILFSGPMVKAIIEYRKTVTRRVVKMDGIATVVGRDSNGELPNDAPRRIPDWQIERLLESCPYGKVGDRLWVRETFARSRNNWLYAADVVVSEGPQGNTDDWDWDATISNVWRPSIFMPREACRLILEITDISVERLQEIAEQDALSEGFSGNYSPAYVSFGEVVGPDGQTPVEEFAETWDRLNARRDHSWDSNPWVWVVEFKAVTK